LYQSWVEKTARSEKIAKNNKQETAAEHVARRACFQQPSWLDNVKLVN